MHSLGYVHNDIKLDNILIDSKEKDTIYLIDFGLSKLYMEKNEIGRYKHINKCQLKMFSGNFLFASNNSI